MTPEEQRELLDRIRRAFPWAIVCAAVQILLIALAFAGGLGWIEISRWGWILLWSMVLLNLAVFRTFTSVTRHFRNPR